MANYTSASVHVLTALTDFNTDTLYLRQQATVPVDANFTFTNGTVNGGNMTLSVSPAIPGSDNNARRTWLTGKRPIKGQLYPRGVYNK